MGEVYRAKDSTLDRDVAIKVLPDEFAQDEERLRRFQREAKLLASLNHANIATLHGLEKSGGTQFLVMEVVEGETLAELIARGPIPIDEALALFKGIADGLEAAHDKGVIHRDLKPANVKISLDGTVTILDFGIAKAFVGEDETSVDASQSQSPTLARSTALGTIMGTASYMSPEQARGQLVDKRTDVWGVWLLFVRSARWKESVRGRHRYRHACDNRQERAGLDAASERDPFSSPRGLRALSREECPKATPRRRGRTDPIRASGSRSRV